MSEVAANLARLRERLAEACARCGRDQLEVTLVAVSKRIPLTRVVDACRAGQSVFGENRLQDAVPRQSELRAALHAAELDHELPRWHFIGSLQSNKARKAVGAFELIHGVDSLALGRRLADIAEQKNVRQPILLQVNVTGEVGKHGLSPESVPDTACELAAASHLDLQGLMTMALAGAAEAELRTTFATLRRLVDDLRQQTALPMPHLSMGMSGDFEAAVAEGSTLVRIGSSVFGPRE